MNPIFLEVERMQYGVGQGCFHTQRISVGRKPEDLHKNGNQFNFVYDCGSKSSAIGNIKPLEWAIDHYEPKKIDALFISHFHLDHINGIELLCKKNTVERLFVPFHTPEDLFTIILEDLNILLDTDDESLVFTLKVLRNLYFEENIVINGKPIPTVYVMPSGEGDDPEVQQLPDTDTDTDSHIFTIPEVVQQQKNKQPLKMYSSQSFVFGDFDTKIWDIRTWHINPAMIKNNKFKEEIDEIKKIIEPIFINNEIEKSIEAFRGDAKKINAALSQEHRNLISMCVYSGPVAQKEVIIIGRSRIQRTNSSVKNEYCHNSCCFGCPCECHSEQLGWLGTGDAMLKINEVWDDFNKKMDWSNTRSKLVSTILMPHHGSFKNYYQPELLIKNPLALFSTGALNKYKHPSSDVIADVLRKGCELINVTEYVRPGVMEIVTAIAM